MNFNDVILVTFFICVNTDSRFIRISFLRLLRKTDEEILLSLHSGLYSTISHATIKLWCEISWFECILSLFLMLSDQMSDMD